MQTLSALFNSILDLLFPRRCLGCSAGGMLLCQECLAHIPPATPAEHSFIKAVFDYRNKVIKRAVWRFKYENVRGFAEVFAGSLYDEMIGTLGDGLHISQDEKFLLVPIPLHPVRLRERGYNQSELLARAVMKRDHEGIFELAPGVLVRTRKTSTQARNEKRAERLKNLRGAFTCADPKRVRGRTIILLDDVTTTGATLLEAKLALARAHPREVLAFTVGH